MSVTSHASSLRERREADVGAAWNAAGVAVVCAVVAALEFATFGKDERETVTPQRVSARGR